MCLAPTGPMFGSLADDPPFLSDRWVALLDQACADAHELGFTLWMYDQIGFSGANFQGRLIAGNPDFAGQALHRTIAHGADGAELVLAPPAGHTALSAVAETRDGVRHRVPLTDGHARWSGGAAALTLFHSGPRGFDYFSLKACAALFDQVHGTLDRAVGHWFGSAIGGFFQDELPPLPTWGSEFAQTFREAHGYDLVPVLGSLWEGDDVGSARVRRDYQSHRAALARSAFFDQQDAWYAEHGLICGFDQASPAREGDPVGGVTLYGDYLDTHSGYGAPGNDHWGDAKVHSSLAHANGHRRTWIEAFHSSGWGGTLEETYDWLAPFLRRGANLYNPHAVYYSTVGGWWEWAAPSTCWRQPYWPAYHVFAGAVSRLCSVLTAGTHVCDTILVSPTSTAQAYLTFDGPLAPARASTECFHALNGVDAWFAEKPGVLERAGLDHDTFDEATVASGEVTAEGMRVGDEVYRTVVLPRPAALLTTTARTLIRFAESGGTVLCVGGAPELFLGEGHRENAEIASRFADAVRSGVIRLVPDAEQVPAEVVRGSVRIEADAPCLVRRDGDTYLVALMAHDDVTGTSAPIVELDERDWPETGFPWTEYWSQLRDTGYRFVPVGERRATVRVRGLPPSAVQQWDPRTGYRTGLTVTRSSDGWSVEVPFEDGSVALVVIGNDLRSPTRTAPGAVECSTDLRGPWTLSAESTLDNQWGDLAAERRGGTLPIEVWRFEHASGDDPEQWQPAIAGFGPFAQVRGPGSDEWTDASWSLARGIHNDPIHTEPLGPKGYVPEDFLDWRSVPAGGRVAVRTLLTLPERGGLHLAVGANAARRVFVDDIELDGDDGSHQSFHLLPEHTRARRVMLRIELVADVDGPVRASFAVIDDVAGYRRPEWISAEQPSVGRSVDLTTALDLADPLADGVVLVASDGPCSVLVNDVEVGRQGDFNPYPGHREIRVHPYDLTSHLRAGPNSVTLRLTCVGGRATAASLDSEPRHRRGAGLITGSHWSARLDGVEVPVQPRRDSDRDPRTRCAWRRPHPLPSADWLEPRRIGDGVERLIPDAHGAGPRTEWLRFPAPLGTLRLRVPTSLPVRASIDGVDHHVERGVISLPGPLAATTPVLLCFDAVDGRGGGALLDGAVEAVTGEVEVPAATFPPWEDLGLSGLGGLVRYRTTVHHNPSGPPTRAVLHLGDVRGTADVLVNGILVDQLAWGPWRSELTDALRPGDNALEIVVRGTLAGYLEHASPTTAITAGQTRTGLFGPVRIDHHQGQA